MNNKVHFFLALDCFPLSSTLKLDEHEDIEVVACPTKELVSMIKFGQVNHALAALGIQLALPYLQAKNLI